MKNYNILVFEEKYNYDTIQLMLDEVGDVQPFFIDNINSCEFLLTSDKVYAIIINENLITLERMYALLEMSIVNTVDIPILITSSLNEAVHGNSKAIYDYINLDNQTTSINKLKMCKQGFNTEKEYSKEMQTLLYTDKLTNLPNREQLIQDVRNESFHINSMSLIDINDFKEINDFYGFRTADALLIMVRDFIKEVLDNNKDILLYKFPQDVFCLAYGGESPRIFEIVSTDIVKKINEHMLHIDGNDIDIRVTSGISFSQKNNKLATANIALNLAKKNNKPYLIFTEELDKHEEYKENMQWLKKVKNALSQDNIIVYFQPLINNRNLKVDKYECLVRMIDGDRIISPFFFLDIAKKSNQYPDITKVVIEKSIETFKDLPFEFSLNISYDDIEDETFLPYLHTLLTKYDIAHKIVWEILEDSDIKDYDVLFNFIDEVKKMGSKVAIDDFGTGYSNFSHILKMDIDYLKIDASLIKNIVEDKTSFKVVKTIIQFAESVGLKTIAEYVESEEIFKLIVGLGADYSQGYFFSAPLASPEKFTYEDLEIEPVIFNSLNKETNK